MDHHSSYHRESILILVNLDRLILAMQTFIDLASTALPYVPSTICRLQLINPYMKYQSNVVVDLSLHPSSAPGAAPGSCNGHIQYDVAFRW